MVGEKTKLLWQNPTYRKRMSEAHKWQTPPSRKGCPPNSGSFKKGYASWTGKKFSEEHCKNISLAHLGQKAWNKGLGIVTSERKRARNTVKYKTWRESVYERDDWTCQSCGTNKGPLNADHELPFALFPIVRFEILNGRTLCEACHKLTLTYGVRLSIKGYDLLTNLITKPL